MDAVGSTIPEDVSDDEQVKEEFRGGGPEPSQHTRIRDTAVQVGTRSERLSFEGQ
jgi:hypothetical protein